MSVDLCKEFLHRPINNLTLTWIGSFANRLLALALPGGEASKGAAPSARREDLDHTTPPGFKRAINYPIDAGYSIPTANMEVCNLGVLSFMLALNRRRSWVVRVE